MIGGMRLLPILLLVCCLYSCVADSQAATPSTATAEEETVVKTREGVADIVFTRRSAEVLDDVGLAFASCNEGETLISGGCTCFPGGSMVNAGFSSLCTPTDDGKQWVSGCLFLSVDQTVVFSKVTAICASTTKTDFVQPAPASVVSQSVEELKAQFKALNEKRRQQ
jgi:hypothetical protein